MKYFYLKSFILLFILKFNFSYSQTTLIRDFNTGSGSGHIYTPVVWKNTLYFGAYLSSESSSWSSWLWKINKGENNPIQVIEGQIFNLIATNKYLIVNTLYPETSVDSFKTYFTYDGAVFNELPSKFEIQDYLVADSIVYFQAYNQNNYLLELYRTDGTVAGTHQIVANYSFYNFVSVQQMYSYNGTLYFVGITANNDWNLYKLNPNYTASMIIPNVERFKFFNGYLYVIGLNSLRTYLVQNGYFNLTKNYLVSSMNSNEDFYQVNNRILLSNMYPPYGREIYYLSHDTLNVVKDTYKDDYPNYKMNFITPVGQNKHFLVYYAKDSLTDEQKLWVTDGTSNGTHIIKSGINSNFIPTGTYDQPYQYTDTGYGSYKFFLAQDDIHGFELWVTDGTSDGTYNLTDINPNSGNSECANIIIFDNRIFFDAYHPTYGRELWSYKINCLETNSVNGIATKDEFADYNLISIQNILDNSKIDYKAQNSIILNAGFKTNLNTTFSAKIEKGCKL